MNYGRLISLGAACEVAYQIKLHTPKADSDYFDWLITPFQAVVDAIAGDFEGMIDADHLILASERDVVINSKTEVKYHHSFPRGEGWKIIENYRDYYERLKSVSDYQSKKFINTCTSGGPVTFIRRGLDAEQARTLTDVISCRYPDLQFTVIAVNDAAVDLICERVKPITVVASGSDGLGRSEAWAEALVGLGMTDKPFQKQQADIMKLANKYDSA